MKIWYTMNYNKYNKYWVVWKNTESEKGCGCLSIFTGNRKECTQKLKELKNEQ